jgi:prevent-host-death family protein
MKKMAISEFKSHALKVLNDLCKDHEPIVITKRGKPIAEVVAYKEKNIEMGGFAGRCFLKEI